MSLTFEVLGMVTKPDSSFSCDHSYSCWFSMDWRCFFPGLLQLVLRSTEKAFILWPQVLSHRFCCKLEGVVGWHFCHRGYYKLLTLFILTLQDWCSIGCDWKGVIWSIHHLGMACRLFSDGSWSAYGLCDSIWVYSVGIKGDQNSVEVFNKSIYF